jgi:hypothetical protein
MKKKESHLPLPVNVTVAWPGLFSDVGDKEMHDNAMPGGCRENLNVALRLVGVCRGLEQHGAERAILPGVLRRGDEIRARGRPN